VDCAARRLGFAPAACALRLRHAPPGSSGFAPAFAQLLWVGAIFGAASRTLCEGSNDG